MGAGFSGATFKTQLKMAIQRLNLHQNKKTNSLQVQRRQIAELLEKGKSPSARIKVEGVIREENMILCMERVALHCELLVQRSSLILSQQRPPDDLIEALTSIMFCANRLEIPEFKLISQQIHLKYGDEWYRQHNENRSNKVTGMIVRKLSVQPPTPNLVKKRLTEIAEEFGIDWEYVPEDEDEPCEEEEDDEEAKFSETQQPRSRPVPQVAPIDPIVPFSPIQPNQGYPQPVLGTPQGYQPAAPAPVYQPQPQPQSQPSLPPMGQFPPPSVHVHQDEPAYFESKDANSLPSVPNSSEKDGGNAVEYDDLEARFAALKKM